MTSLAAAPFGRLLRQHRVAAGLSQELLAERAGLSARGIRALERGDRTLPHPHTLRLLADCLGLTDGERAAFNAAARPEFAESLPPPAPSPGLPATSTRPDPGPYLPIPPTALVGREGEAARVSAMLGRTDVRLVSLTGPGGVGKTRLALKVAAEIGDGFADGICFVDLSPVRDPALVASALAQELGVRETSDQPLVQHLATALRDKHLLLVIDNFEQVLAGAADLVSLLAACRRLTMLVTSREALRIRGEHVFAVVPLPLPPDEASPVDLSGNDAVRLFCERAQAVRPDFGFTDADAGPVAAICHRLNGLPLAIELAAARIAIFPPKALLTGLERRLPLLTGGARDLPGRHQSMRDTIAWSYDLLTAAEQVLFRRLVVFIGGFTLEAAEMVGRSAAISPWP